MARTRTPTQATRPGTKTPPKKTEAQVQREALRELQRHPSVDWAIRVNSGKVRTASGHWLQLAPEDTSDLIGMLVTSRAMFFEVKKPGKEPTAGQWAFLQERAERGAKCGWGFDAVHAIEFLQARHDGRVWSPER